MLVEAGAVRPPTVRAIEGLEVVDGGVRRVTPCAGIACPPQVVAESADRITDQEDVMSRTRTPTRPTVRAIEGLAARRRAARSRQELRAVLAGLHGEGVRADVLAAMKR